MITRTLLGRWVMAGGCCVLLLGAAPRVLAERGCGLDDRNTYGAALPVIGPGEMTPGLEAELKRTYRMVSIEFRSKEAEPLLKLLRDRGIAERSACAEALANFELGQGARLIHLAEATGYFARAEELLGTVGTPLALALVHERLATTKHMVGDNAGFLKDAPKMIADLQAAGDEAAAIIDESNLLEWRDDGDKTAEQAALYKRAAALTAPNATAARGFVQRNWGANLRHSGHVAESMDHFRAAVMEFTKCDCMPPTRAVAYLEMALAADEESDDAMVLTYALEGDRIYREYHLDSFRPQALRVIAASYQHRGDRPRAIATLETALKIAREQHAVFSIHIIGDALAGAYGDAGQPLKGIEVLESTRPAKPTPAQSCAAQGRMVMLAAGARLYERASDVAKKALAECQELLAPIDVAAMTWQYADVELQLGQTEGALVNARKAVDRIELDRSRLETTDRNLVAFNTQQVSAYSVWIQALVALHKTDEALLASEQYRARAFVDLAMTPRKDAEPVLKSEVHPFTLTVDAMRESMAAQRSTMLSYWLGNHGELYIWLMAPGRPVFMAERKVDPVKLAALVKATVPSDGTGSSKTMTRGARVLTRGGGSEAVVGSSHQPWRDLYAMLIAPVAAELPQERGSLLTIVPQGSLFALSFPALLDVKGRYLIERYAIHTVPSAGVLQVTAKNDREASAMTPRFLLVANPEHFPSVHGRPLPALPGTELEARGISTQLAGKQVTLLEGRAAGINSMIDALPQTTTLHLATHAVVSDDAPLTSFLALDRSQRGGMLTAASVYGLRMHANLVVLSACSTGRGKISGDGVAGLSRAFFYAGAASLVTTLWDVVDAPTAELMPKFYAGLAKGESRSMALRAAQLALIRDLRMRRVQVKTLSGAMVSLPESPAYWAAFSLTGQP